MLTAQEHNNQSRRQVEEVTVNNNNLIEVIILTKDKTLIKLNLDKNFLLSKRIDLNI
jgi:hypothetical protein